MSDTTTITPEERAAIRSPSERWDALWYPHDRCHKMMLRLLTALEAAEAALLKEEVYSEELESQLQHAREENERLRAERDWLAENVEGRPCDYDSCPFGLPRPTGPDYGCGKTHVQCWQEALTPRHAVAAGEGE